MELESYSQLDAINIQHNIQISGLREQLMELATRRTQHPSLSVSSKAHLAIFAAHAVDLMFSPTQETLDLLVNVYQAHVDGIVGGEKELFVVAELLNTLIEKHQFDDVIALRRDLTNRMLIDGVVDFEKMSLSQKERIVFGDLGLRTLISRLDGVDKTAAEDAELLYERLARFPDARKEILVAALTVIDKYLINEQFEFASGSLAALQRVQPQIPDAEIGVWFDRSLSEYTEKIRMAQSAN
jgi:hypothetical protein